MLSIFVKTIPFSLECFDIRPIPTSGVGYFCRVRLTHSSHNFVHLEYPLPEMTFNLNDFRILPAGGIEWEADLLAILNHYQGNYFSGVSPITSVEFVHSLDGPSVVFPEIGRIEVDERFRIYPKLCCLLVLHELVNNKLFREHGREVAYGSPEHFAELDRLWKAGAYKDIL